jgi:KDO2-lipid IV(A) lauroyltransferase
MMIGFFFFRVFVFLFWITPFWILYIYSDFIFFLFYHILGYRKDVVLENLKNSFPHKSDSELQEIVKGFYKNLSDVIVESLKGLSMSKKELLKRYKVITSEVADKYHGQNRSVIAVASHYCNWEWGVLCFSLQLKHNSVGLYKPMSNKYIDNYIRSRRAAWGMNLVSIYETAEYFEQKNLEPSIYFMIADQSPGDYNKAHWIDFLNQETACLHGPEKYAKLYDLPVVYADVERIKRGYYEVSFLNIEPNPREKPQGEITLAYMKTLENIILEKPENWLWSHKRWKRKRSI